MRRDPPQSSQTRGGSSFVLLVSGVVFRLNRGHYARGKPDFSDIKTGVRMISIDKVSVGGTRLTRSH